jgi:hypothetical protein
MWPGGRAKPDAYKGSSRHIFRRGYVCEGHERAPHPASDLMAAYVIPRKEGGVDGPLVVLCRACNSRRDATGPVTWTRSGQTSFSAVTSCSRSLRASSLFGAGSPGWSSATDRPVLDERHARKVGHGTAHSEHT